MNSKKEIFFILIVGVLGVAIAIFSGYYMETVNPLAVVSALISILLAGIAWYSSTSKYLNKDIKEVLEKSVKSQVTMEKPKNKKFPEKENNIVDDEYHEIFKTLLEEKIRNHEEEETEEYTYADHIALKRGDVFRVFESSERRIQNEINSLSRRANLNLIIGSLVAILGIAGLVGFILSSPTNNEGVEPVMIIIHWVIRLSLISVVEVFAFFFLQIYKTELLSIKYYQDEMTSIESRKIALLFSVLQDNCEDVSKALSYIVSVDRNFKMDSNQTTVELEKLKTENSFIRSQMESMQEIFRGVLNFNKQGA